MSGLMHRSKQHLYSITSSALVAASAPSMNECGRNMKDRLAADFSEIQSSGLRSRGRYGNTVSNFDSSPTLKFRWNF
jgi:hypothetical protein